MWVIEEQVDGRKLTEIINSQHENFLGRVLVSIKQQGLKEGAMAVSLIKGINFDDRGVVLVSDLIHEGLDVDCSVLMGANVANNVAAGDFC
ncbi:Glycerol-3-phosphate dehydrogenase 1-like protein [Phytophthora ramorum]|uniref:Glycerol-3-phosphate dehydrogenase 1-like protein n=1 Tax=Phytophthora ramorum TaxID=164328 RepID=UPI003099740C|nr:Glycerol-3-phosphate dehydrogenase 1-like protein [Phytophthora ramorum]